MTDADATEPHPRLARFLAMKAKFPQSEMPRWSLATALEELERVPEAIAEFRELVLLKPDYCVAWLRLGACLVKVGDAAAAREALGRTIQLAIAEGHQAPRPEALGILAELDDD